MFELDGVVFPWHLTAAGPRIRLNEHGLYEIDVTILAERVIGQ